MINNVNKLFKIQMVKKLNKYFKIKIKNIMRNQIMVTKINFNNISKKRFLLKIH